MQEAEKFTHNNRTVTIYYDPEPLNPRKEYDNLSVFACWHRRANLGDEQIGGCTEEEMRAKLAEYGDPIVAILPLYIYEHGDMTMKTTPFGCSWDSGQVGWAYVTKSSAEKRGCVGPAFKYDKAHEDAIPDGEWDVAKWEEQIRGEVVSYGAYLRGECFGYEVTGIDGDDIDSCWGFLGDIEFCREEARSSAEHSDDPGIDRRVEELASRATYAGVGA